MKAVLVKLAIGLLLPLAVVYCVTGILLVTFGHYIVGGLMLAPPVLALMYLFGDGWNTLR